MSSTRSKLLHDSLTVAIVEKNEKKKIFFDISSPFFNLDENMVEKMGGNCEMVNFKNRRKNDITSLHLHHIP